MSATRYAPFAIALLGVALHGPVAAADGTMPGELVDQTKLVTAASELARNTLVHGGGGDMRLQALNDGRRRGVKVIFTDQGPGIPDIELAMKDGYTTRGGLGLGLSGSKRLVNEFEIESQPGKGTTVRIVRWK